MPASKGGAAPAPYKGHGDIARSGAHDHAGDHSAHDHGATITAGTTTAGTTMASMAMPGTPAPASFGRAFVVGIALNVALVAAQVGFGFAAHSVALLADAVHNIGDVLGLLAAWGAASMAKWAPTPAVHLRLGPHHHPRRAGQRRHPAGRHRRARAGGGPAAVHPGPGGGLDRGMLVAAAGILINGATALMFMRGRHRRPERARRLPAHGGRRRACRPAWWSRRC